MQETLEMQVWSSGWENPLEKEMAIHPSILAWEISWTEELGGITVHRVEKSQTWLSFWTQQKQKVVSSSWNHGPAGSNDLEFLSWRLRGLLVLCVRGKLESFSLRKARAGMKEIWKIKLLTRQCLGLWLGKTERQKKALHKESQSNLVTVNMIFPISQWKESLEIVEMAKD